MTFCVLIYESLRYCIPSNPLTKMCGLRTDLETSSWAKRTPALLNIWPNFFSQFSFTNTYTACTHFLPKTTRKASLAFYEWIRENKVFIQKFDKIAKACCEKACRLQGYKPTACTTCKGKTFKTTNAIKYLLHSHCTCDYDINLISWKLQFFKKHMPKLKHMYFDHIMWFDKLFGAPT